jgi:hypothetical protein
VEMHIDAAGEPLLCQTVPVRPLDSARLRQHRAALLVVGDCSAPKLHKTLHERSSSGSIRPAIRAALDQIKSRIIVRVLSVLPSS